MVSVTGNNWLVNRTETSAVLLHCVLRRRGKKEKKRKEKKRKGKKRKEKKRKEKKRKEKKRKEKKKPGERCDMSFIHVNVCTLPNSTGLGIFMHRTEEK